MSVFFPGDWGNNEIACISACWDAQRLLAEWHRPVWWRPENFFPDRASLVQCALSPIEERFACAFPMVGRNGMFVKFCAALDKAEVDTLPPNENYLIPQFPVGNWRLDFALIRKGPDGNLLAKIAIECDGHEFHERTSKQASRDRKRDRELQQLGWVVLRFTGSEIHNDVYGCCEEAIKHLIRVSGGKGYDVDKTPGGA